MVAARIVLTGPDLIRGTAWPRELRGSRFAWWLRSGTGMRKKGGMADLAAALRGGVKGGASLMAACREVEAL